MPLEADIEKGMRRHSDKHAHDLAHLHERLVVPNHVEVLDLAHHVTLQTGSAWLGTQPQRNNDTLSTSFSVSIRSSSDRPSSGICFSTSTRPSDSRRTLLTWPYVPDPSASKTCMKQDVIVEGSTPNTCALPGTYPSLCSLENSLEYEFELLPNFNKSHALQCRNCDSAMSAHCTSC